LLPLESPPEKKFKNLARFGFSPITPIFPYGRKREKIGGDFIFSENFLNFFFKNIFENYFSNYFFE